MTDNLVLWELQKIHDALTKTKEERTLHFRMIKPTEKFNINGPILNTTKLGLFRFSVYNSVFNVKRRYNQFLYAITVLDREEALPRALSSDPNFNSSPNPKSNGERAVGPGTPTWAKPHSSSNITSVFNYNYKGIPLLYSTITPGAYELTDIAKLIKEETNGNVIIEPDKNTMKCLMEIKQGALGFDVENSIAPLQGFRKIVYKKCNYTSQTIVDIMRFSTINIH